MSKAYFEQEIEQRISELNSMEDVLGIGTLTLNAYTSASRSSMVTQHMVQALVPDKPEVPGVSMGYEYMFGQYSTAYKKSQTKLKIIKKIVKHDGYVYTLLTYNPKTEEYGIIERRDSKSLAEDYGYKYNNEKIDSYKVGDTIPKDTVLYRAPVIDEYGNYMYGVNAKIVYVVSQETIEDAVVVSESFAKRFTTTKVKSVKVPLNDNDIPLNLYGDNDSYKAFPDIGEKSKKSILIGTRRKDKSLDQLNLKNSNLRKIFPNDDLFQILDKHTVIDIDIWSNKSYEEIPDLPAYAQVKKYYKRLLDYYTEIYEEFGKLVDSGAKYTAELSRLYAKARDYIDPSCKYMDEEKMFSNMIMEFTVTQSTGLTRGCKICGRYGNKSVISKIIPDEEMGMTEDGIVPDVRMDALGVIGRLNTGQCFEQELNWIASIVQGCMKTATKLKDRKALLYRFLKLANKDMYEDYFNYLEMKTIDQQEKEMDDIINDRIYIMQSPINSISGDGMYKLYKEFNPTPKKMIYLDENGRKYKSLKPLIVADEYILRLKQEPITKFSVRSKSTINPRSFLPIKSTKASKHKTLYPDQSNKVGKLCPDIG